MRAARQNPDGTFVHDEEIYRLEDREHDHFAVRRLRDQRVVGGLRFSGNRCDVETETDVLPREAEAVRAIARLLQTARGLLPLQ